jgi:hypothetical protein
VVDGKTTDWQAKAVCSFRAIAALFGVFLMPAKGIQESGERLFLNGHEVFPE